MNQRNFVVIYTDGACSNNPGSGGWGAIVLDPSDFVYELGGHEPSTTNNRMELTSTICSLERVAAHPVLGGSSVPILVLTDSRYVINGIEKWIHGWKRNGWKTAEGKEVINRDLWEIFGRLAYNNLKGRIRFQYVRGHTGVPGNERCDEVAVNFSKGMYVSLYSGSLSNYSVDILPLPEKEIEDPNKEPRSSSSSNKKKVAYSYLSAIGHSVVRHKSWASCERRVKGQPGARFKKSFSSAEEVQILSSWGLVDVKVTDDAN